jgi:hypothetical protein
LLAFDPILLGGQMGFPRASVLPVIMVSALPLNLADLADLLARLGNGRRLNLGQRWGAIEAFTLRPSTRFVGCAAAAGLPPLRAGAGNRGDTTSSGSRCGQATAA